MPGPAAKPNEWNERPVADYRSAWIYLCLTLAVHITDEVLTDFLSVYNPTVEAIRQRFGLPLPTFTFPVWLTGLILAVGVLLILSRFAVNPSRWIVLLGYVFAILMLGNGLLHISASIYFGRLMPGVYSSPLLLICSTYLLVSVWKRLPAGHTGVSP